MKSLYPLYQYGRLHGGERLRWGLLDYSTRTSRRPRSGPGDRRLFDIMTEALEGDGELDVVLRTARGWKEPLSRARRVTVQRDSRGFAMCLLDADGYAIEDAEAQVARLPDDPAT